MSTTNSGSVASLLCSGSPSSRGGRSDPLLSADGWCGDNLGNDDQLVVMSSDVGGV